MLLGMQRTGAVSVTRHRSQMTWYDNGSCCLSVHKSRNCLIDYGAELRDLNRSDAAKVLKKMRRGERVEYGLGTGYVYSYIEVY
jgi:hypothetical protein